MVVAGVLRFCQPHRVTGIPPALKLMWDALGGCAEDLDAATLTGPKDALASIFAVTDLAAGAATSIGLSAAMLFAAPHRALAMPHVRVDRLHAAAAFDEERLLQPIGWPHPPLRHPLSGDYPTKDGWIRLHMNYEKHLAAALAVLGAPSELDQVRRAVARVESGPLEEEILWPEAVPGRC